QEEEKRGGQPREFARVPPDIVNEQWRDGRQRRLLRHDGGEDDHARSDRPPRRRGESYRVDGEQQQKEKQRIDPSQIEPGGRDVVTPRVDSSPQQSAVRIPGLPSNDPKDQKQTAERSQDRDDPKRQEPRPEEPRRSCRYVEVEGSVDQRNEVERRSDVERPAIEHAAHLLETVTFDGLELEWKSSAPGSRDEEDEDPEHCRASEEKPGGRHGSRRHATQAPL